MQNMLLVLVVVCTLGVRLAFGTPPCDKDACKNVTCTPVTECPNGRIIPNVGPCGCCAACVPNEDKLRVGSGKRCGPPTYFSCDPGLVCTGSPGNGICQWP